MVSATPTAPPILDFSAFRSSNPSERETLINQIRTACRDKGFFQLTNHGISSDLQTQTLSACKQFFDLPLSEKLKIDLKFSKHNRGYERHGSQMLEAGTAPESKEGLYLGKDLPLDHPRVVAGEYNCGPNPWLEALGEEFKDVCMEYYQAVEKLANEVIKALALGLGLKEGWFDEFTSKPSGTLRFIHYPPTPTTSSKARGIGAHRDFGCITLLMQDQVGGLQVLDEASGEWLDVTPVPGAYVVNLGNLMMKWTNHVYNSNMHRVMNFSSKDRYSIPFFYSGDQSYVFDCIPGCEGENGEKGEKMVVGEYMKRQFDTSYNRVLEQETVATS
ncbi:hypothetical protein G7Y89_g10291 [Cudoniella acicularis]|uniref:Fe2OG dioxygenase domain-containing protein n=1 Tax=Cudoniella acicularis TaxID=354080 RepID=A0A8H4RFT7_9HELO|nr:hypothetical protein G7Y89_g10291 [Cudoniella acicularis]